MAEKTFQVRTTQKDNATFNIKGHSVAPWQNENLVVIYDANNEIVAVLPVAQLVSVVDRSTLT